MTKKIEVFASEALPGELEAFPDIKRGWGTTKETTGGIPPMKWFNAIQKRTDEAINAIAEGSISGYTFKDGATLDSHNDLIYDDVSKSWYFWIGGNGKVIPPNSNASEIIETDGGIWSDTNPDGLWVNVGDGSLRSELKDGDGSLIGVGDGTTLHDFVLKQQDQDSAVLYATDFGLNPSASAEDNDRALYELSRAVKTKSNNTKVVFPSGNFRIGSQRRGVGAEGAWVPNSKFVLLDWFHSLELHFNSTNFVFETGLRVGAFDPVDGEPLTTRQTEMQYRAYRGNVFYLYNVSFINITGSCRFLGNAGSAILGGEFGDRGYQCPECFLWASRYITLDSTCKIITEDGVYDGIYLDGSTGDRARTTFTNFSTDRMGRTGVAVVGGENMYFAGSCNRTGLGSVPNSPGVNFNIEDERGSVSNVTVEIHSVEALSTCFAVWNENNSISRVKVINSVLTNRTGKSIGSNSPNVDYINCTITGQIGMHTTAKPSNRSQDMARIRGCNIYDYNGITGTPTRITNGLIFSVDESVTLDISDSNIYVSEILDLRKTIGRLVASKLNNVSININGGYINWMAGNGIKILDLVSPKKLIDFTFNNKATGDLTTSWRSYIGLSDIESTEIRNAKIVSTVPTATLWFAKTVAEGGVSGKLQDTV